METEQNDWNEEEKDARMSESNRDEADRGPRDTEGRVLPLAAILISWERDTGSEHELHQWR